LPAIFPRHIVTTNRRKFDADRAGRSITDDGFPPIHRQYLMKPNVLQRFCGELIDIHPGRWHGGRSTTNPSNRTNGLLWGMREDAKGWNFQSRALLVLGRPAELVVIPSPVLVVAFKGRAVSDFDFHAAAAARV
jgi:hypothetical protein